MTVLVAAKQTIKRLLPTPVIETARDFRHRNDIHPNYLAYTSAVADKSGVEIGGPTTWLFRYTLPLYQSVENLDGVNFSSNTIWEGNISGNDGRYNYYKSRSGKQYISEASDLSEIPDDVYDFLISSNCLEHIANPIKAVQEWQRVVAPGGTIIVFVPDKAHCFDHRREFTTFSHLMDDYEKDVNEADLTHLDEILDKHDYSMDEGSRDKEYFRARSLDNFNSRCLHHHVFSLKLLEDIFSFVGIETVRCEAIVKNLAIIGRASRSKSDSARSVIR
jgi:SAM-dependent methyltransferase